MIREISIGAVVYNEDKFLLLKYGLGHWGLVKGHKDKGEKDKDTILRELREETGISSAKIIKGFKDNIVIIIILEENPFLKPLHVIL